MIIRTIAKALVQCSARTQAGWMTPTPKPTLYLHGATDGCVGASLAADASAHLPSPGSRAEVVDGVGHFLHVEDPDRVGTLIVDFLTQDPT